MKATGIVRRLDDLGRIVIPKEIRRNLGFKEGDSLEIFTDKGMVCFRKYYPIGQLNIALIKKICDNSLGKLNYTVYNTDGEAILPEGVTELNLKDKNISPINCDGECIGYIQSPSGNRQVTAEIVGGMLEE